MFVRIVQDAGGRLALGALLYGLARRWRTGAPWCEALAAHRVVLRGGGWRGAGRLREGESKGARGLREGRYRQLV